MSVTSDDNERATGLVSVTSDCNERATGTVQHIINPATAFGQQPGEAAAYSPAALGPPTADEKCALLHRQEGGSSQGLDPTLAVTARNETDDYLHALKPPKMEGVRQEATEQYDIASAVAPTPRYGSIEPSLVQTVVPRTEGPARFHDVLPQDNDRKAYLEGLVRNDTVKDFYDLSPNFLETKGREVVHAACVMLRDPSIPPQLPLLAYAISNTFATILPGARPHTESLSSYDDWEFMVPSTNTHPATPAGGIPYIGGSDVATYVCPPKEIYEGHNRTFMLREPTNDFLAFLEAGDHSPYLRGFLQARLGHDGDTHILWSAVAPSETNRKPIIARA